MVVILLCMRVEVEFTICTFLKCLFLTEGQEPPLTNPLAIVLITPRTRVPRWLSMSFRRLGYLELLLFKERCLRSSLLELLLRLLLGKRWVLCINILKCLAYINSFILSFNVIHSSVLCL